VAAAWDRRTPAEQAKVRDAGIARQLATAVGPFSPFWRERLQALGLRSRDVGDLPALQRLPAVGEDDVCPGGDPAGAARLVLQPDETGWALTVGGPTFRHGITERLRGQARYRRLVQASIRPVAYHYGGRRRNIPLASTRDDLDLMARAGARLWAVLGLTDADVLVSGVAATPSVEHLGLTYAALGAGSPALFPGDDRPLLAETLRLVPATVLAFPTATAVRTLRALGAAPASVTTVLLVGPPDEATRATVATLLPRTRVLAVWGPAEGRVLYAESEPGAGLVTYPDLEVLEVVDPATGELADADSGGELVLTQLGWRGSALLRWRTGVLVDAPLTGGTAPDGRTVPRIPSRLVVRDGPATVPASSTTSTAGPTTAAPPPASQASPDPLVELPARLAGVTGVAAARVQQRHSARDQSEQLLVHVTPALDADLGHLAVAVARRVRATIGHYATQLVIEDVPPGEEPPPP
jgi:hypothetical protein